MCARSYACFLGENTCVVFLQTKGPHRHFLVGGDRRIRETPQTLDEKAVPVKLGNLVGNGSADTSGA